MLSAVPQYFNDMHSQEEYKIFSTIPWFINGSLTNVFSSIKEHSLIFFMFSDKLVLFFLETLQSDSVDVQLAVLNALWALAHNCQKVSLFNKDKEVYPVLYYRKSAKEVYSCVKLRKILHLGLLCRTK